MGKGASHSELSPQKLNTRCSTEAELVAADLAMTNVLWTKWFCEAQGYKITSNVLQQDNESAIRLEKNGKFSLHKATRHINIRYFFITDQINKKNVTVKYCPTDDLTADFMSKPLQGAKFQKFKSMIMNIPLEEKNGTVKTRQRAAHVPKLKNDVQKWNEKHRMVRQAAE